MTKVTLVNKDAVGDFAETSATNDGVERIITLKSNSIVKLDINTDSIKSVTKQDNDAVIHLKDGSKVILENFYVIDNPKVILQNGQQFWVLKSTQDSAGYTLVDYAEVNNEADPFILSSSSFLTLGVTALASGGAIALFTRADSKDTTPPVAGSLKLNNFTDTGISATDQITQDKSFNLIISGQEFGSTVIYLISRDNGQTWQETTITQSDLVDGSYWFKAVVTDAAGNRSETAVQKVVIDTTPPTAGVLQLGDFTDTGVSTIDQISQDHSFTLALTAQEIGANVSYLMSKDNGQTWTETTVSQTDLVDGSYQFKAVVTDAVGNRSETAVQKVLIDTTLPTAGVITLQDFTDTGISATDQITQDRSFNLVISGQEFGSTVVYLISKDNGQTWEETTITQSDLVDGSYWFKAVVTDAAGNRSETAIQKVTVDSQLELLSDIVQIESVTEDNTISLSEKDQMIPVRIQIDHLPSDVDQKLTNVSTLISGTIFDFTFDSINQAWVAEIPAISLWSEQQQNSLTIDISFTDIAGNTATLQQIHDFQLNHIPTAPQILEAKSNDLDGSVISGTAYKGSIVDFYTVNGKWIASTVANEQGKFILRTSIINADQEIYITARVDEYISEASSSITVVEVPFLNILKISPEGIITGYATEGSHFSVRDTEGNLIQVSPFIEFDGAVTTPLNLMASGTGQLFRFTLDQPLAEGKEIIITAEKDGVIGYPQLIVVDYTPAEFLEQPAFNDEGNTLLVHTNESNTNIQIFSELTGDLIGFGYSDENGVAHVEIWQTLQEGEQVKVQLIDKNQNMSEVVIGAPNLAYAPDIFHISQDGQISGWAETNSTIILKDANGIVLGETLSGEGFIWKDFTEFSLSANRSLAEGEQLFIHIVDAKGLVSPETIIHVDFTPPPAPTNLYFNEDGDWIYGTAEAFTEIIITDKNGTVLNHWGWGGWTNQDGNFAVELNHYLTNADTVYITAKDKNGNISLVTEATAPNYAFAPSVDNLTNTGLFTGYAEINSTLIIKDIDKIVVAELRIENNNNLNDLNFFSLSLDRLLTNGDVFYLSIIDDFGNISAETLVVADVQAPEPAQNLNFIQDGSHIIGLAESGTTIQVHHKNGMPIVWDFYVQNDGSFDISLNSYYLHGEEFIVTVTDRAGNISEPISIKAPIDDIAPKPIENIIFDVNGVSFQAQSEANSYIEVFNEFGQKVGYGFSFENGTVSGNFYQTYLKGQELTFVVIDRAGNRSVEVKQTALNDDVAPNAITDIVFNENGQNFIGLAEAESRIEVFDATGAQVGWGSTDSLGKVSGYLNQTYLKGQELTFVVIDRAGNRSVEVKQTALNDDVAPNAITDIVFNENGQNFIGLAEAESRIEVFDATGAQVGWGSTDSLGEVSGYLNQTYLKGQELTFVVIDRAGNRSVEVKQTALNDDVAPNAIKNIIFNENGQNFTAIAEA